MALKIRLKRIGTRNRPFYHLIVADSRSPRNGKFIEKVGYYNPMVEPKTIELQEERIAHWYQLGAEPTESVTALMRTKKIYLNNLKRS
jgi:small subunit ribosomal protein S16